MATVTGYTTSGIYILLTPIRYIVNSIKTANYTLVAADDYKCIEMNVSTPNNLTVPPMADQAIPVGSTIIVHQRGTGITTIVPGTSVTLRSLDDNLTSAGQWSRINLYKVAANEWYVYGDLVAP